MDSEIDKYFDRHGKDGSGGSPKLKTNQFLGEGLFARDEDFGEPHSALEKTRSGMLSPTRRVMKSSGT